MTGDASLSSMDHSQPPPSNASKQLARRIAHRERQNALYANDPEYRERCKESSRIYAAKRRALAKASRAQLIASGELIPGKPGRPKREPVSHESPPSKKRGRPRLLRPSSDVDTQPRIDPGLDSCRT